MLSEYLFNNGLRKLRNYSYFNSLCIRAKFAKMEEKHQRQGQLIALLKNKVFNSQSAICAEMRQRGFSVTQPSICRDLRELGVVKISGRYLQPQATGEIAIVKPRANKLSVHAAGTNLIVAKTPGGAATFLAAQLDQGQIPGLKTEDVMGTVAGDDTVFIAVSGRISQQKVIDKLKKFNLGAK